MPGEKTEQPTQKRLNDSRKKGEVFKSKDFVQALLFMVAAAVLIAGGPAYVAELRDLMKEFFTPVLMQGTMPANAILSRMGYAWSKFMILSAPLLALLHQLAYIRNWPYLMWSKFILHAAWML